MTPTKTMTQTNSFKTSSRTKNKEMMIKKILIMRTISSKKPGGKNRQTTKRMIKRWKL